MYLVEIEELVKNDEYEFYNNKTKLNSRLLRLSQNEEYRKNYFSRINLDKFNVVEYNKLKSEYNRLYDKADKLTYINKKAKKFKINLVDLSNKIDNIEVNIKIKKELINHFKEDLSYMLYLGIISEKGAKKRGFSSKFIKSLMRQAQNEIEEAYNAYLFDYDLEKGHENTSNQKLLLLK